MRYLHEYTKAEGAPRDLNIQLRIVSDDELPIQLRHYHPVRSDALDDTPEGRYWNRRASAGRGHVYELAELPRCYVRR